jgi:signal transduction histidine kinase
MPRVSMVSSLIGRPRSHRLKLRWRRGSPLGRAWSAPATNLELGQYLHDEVGQWLALAMLQVDSIRSPMPAADDALLQLRGSLERASLAIRDAMHRLDAPPDACSLRAAIVQTLTSSPWAARPLVTKLSPALTELALAQSPFAPRIIRELVANAHRHAHASRVELRAWRRGAVLHIQVQDNGIGLNHMDGNSHYGLVSVRRQVTKESGHLRLDTRAGYGTRIDVQLPLRRIEHDLAEACPRPMGNQS